MNDFQIDTDIPVPPRINYPFRHMEVGESFVQPDLELGKKLRGIIYQYGKRNGKKFSVKLTEPSGYRVWRTK
jgi:hypothetical protein